MKIEMGQIPIRVDLEQPAIGDVYRAKGGRGETKFFVVVAIVGRVAHALGLNREGDIVSTTSYGCEVFAARDVVGRIPGLSEMTLNIEWEAI